MFVSKDTATVTDAKGNIITIKAKMDFGTQQRVAGDATAANVGADGKPTATLNIGVWNLALLKHNVVSWAGPDFEGVACTPENIEGLDPTEPIVDLVLSDLNTRNSKPKTDAKN